MLPSLPAGHKTTSLLLLSKRVLITPSVQTKGLPLNLLLPSQLFQPFHNMRAVLSGEK